jgi:lysophospholipase L1-like esterase
MKTILCFGDSNTWGYNPATKERFSREARWTGVLKQALGSDYEVIEEGCNGRTTVWDDPIEGYKNGQEYLYPCLVSHKPLDLVIIMLGTNDLKRRFSLSAFDVAEGAGVLVDIVQRGDCGPQNQTPKVLLIAPPPLAQLTEYKEMFEGAEVKSRGLSEQYRRVAQEYGCELLDASTVVSSSNIDGIHFEAGEHKKLGQAIAARVREILG